MTPTKQKLIGTLFNLTFQIPEPFYLKKNPWTSTAQCYQNSSSTTIASILDPGRLHVPLLTRDQLIGRLQVSLQIQYQPILTIRYVLGSFGVTVVLSSTSGSWEMLPLHGIRRWKFIQIMAKVFNCPCHWRQSCCRGGRADTKLGFLCSFSLLDATSTCKEKHNCAIANIHIFSKCLKTLVIAMLFRAHSHVLLVDFNCSICLTQQTTIVHWLFFPKL